MGYVSQLGRNLNFLSPLGLLTFLDFLSFLFILKLSYSKPFHYTLNYASTANIEEVIKFYNLGHKIVLQMADFSLFFGAKSCQVPSVILLHGNSLKFNELV